MIPSDVLTSMATIFLVTITVKGPRKNLMSRILILADDVFPLILYTRAMRRNSKEKCAGIQTDILREPLTKPTKTLIKRRRIARWKVNVTFVPLPEDNKERTYRDWVKAYLLGKRNEKQLKIDGHPRKDVLADYSDVNEIPSSYSST